MVRTVTGSEVFVRIANESDRESIDELVDRAREEQKRHRGSWVRPPGVSPDGAILTLVGGLGQTVLGVISAREGIGRSWGIELLHVHEDGRGVGVGDALVLALMSELRARSAQSLTGAAQPGDRSLKNLFERHGLVARTILVGREL